MLKINAQNYNINEIDIGNKNYKGGLVYSLSRSYVHSNYTMSKKMMAVVPKGLTLT